MKIQRKPSFFGYRLHKGAQAKIPHYFADVFLVLLAICLVFGFILYARQFFGPYQEKFEIDLSPKHLPLYTFFSLSRGLAAYVCSFIFSLAFGFWAAKDRLAEKVLIPLLDILQSIPFLGFLPGVVLVLVSLFQKSNIGLELAAIALIFSAQAWNMTFGVYHAVRSIPDEKKEFAVAYNLTQWQRFHWVELPSTTLSLVWNSIMSMAGGWFFLMVIEAYRLGNREFRLPGLGSYMSVAAAEGNVSAMIWAVLAMVLLILLLDQILWRPLVVWSQKFRIEDTGPSVVTETWFLNVLKNSYILLAIRKFFPDLVRTYPSKIFRRVFGLFWPIFDFKLGGYIHCRYCPPRPESKIGSKEPKNRLKLFIRIGSKRERASRRLFPLILSRFFLMIVLGLLITAAVFVIRKVSDIPLDQWLYLGQLVLLTLARVLACLSIGILIALPLGLAVGLSEKWSRIFEPFIQVGASFPATLLFPMMILFFEAMGIPLGIGSILLMLMGSFWYIFLNVIAGARAMPSDLKEVAESFTFSRKQRFFGLNLPAVFPYLVTGIVSGAAGAWNTSIVSEYVSYKNEILTTPGIGSSISLAAQNNDMELLTASVLILVVVVVTINLAVWLRLYHYSEKRFAING